MFLVTFAVTSWINTNLRSKGLVHCMIVSSSTVVLFGTNLADAISEVSEELAAKKISIYAFGEGSPIGEK